MHNNEEFIKYRLESLKLSYDINFKIGNLKSSYKTEEEVNKDLQDVFSLADINLQYIIYGTHPSEGENEETNK